MNLAKAKYDNLAECPDELAFRRSDVLTVIDQNLEGLSGWWLCSLRGKQGIVPANRLTLLAGMYNESSLLFSTDTPDSNALKQVGTGGPEYDVPRECWQHANQTAVIDTPEQALYDSPKHLGDVNEAVGGFVHASHFSHNHPEDMYDRPNPSALAHAVRPTSSGTSMRYSSTVDGAIDSFNNSDRSSSLYDYPSSLSDGYSTTSGGGLAHDKLLSRYSTSSNPTYDNNTSYCLSPHFVDTGHTLSPDKRETQSPNKSNENVYDVIPAASSRQLPDAELRPISFLPDELDLDTALEILVKLQQLIHTSIARLKVDCPSLFSPDSGRSSNKAYDSSGFITITQTLSISLRRLVEVAQYCMNRAALSGRERLASSLNQLISPLMSSVDTLNTLTKNMEQKSQTLSSVCHAVTENVTKLASLIHGNITLLFHPTLSAGNTEPSTAGDLVDSGSNAASRNWETHNKSSGYDEYDYCEVTQSIPDTVTNSKRDAKTSPTVTIGEDAEKYVTFYLAHVRAMQKDVEASLASLETDHDTVPVRRVLLSVNKTVYVCDALRRVLPNDTPIAASLVAKVVAIVNNLCIGIKSMVLAVNRSRGTGRRGGDNSKQLMGVADDLRSSYNQLITMLELSS